MAYNKKKRLKAQDGYQWINIKVDLFTQVAKTKNASVISNLTYSPKM